MPKGRLWYQVSRPKIRQICDRGLLLHRVRGHLTRCCLCYGLADKQTSNKPGKYAHTGELNAGLWFLYEQYKTQNWYWELVQIIRKLIFTSGLILIGGESRSYVGLACVMSGIFATAFAHRHPILKKFENNLQQLLTFVHLGIGTISKIPSENFPNDVDQYVDKLVLAKHTRNGRHLKNPKIGEIKIYGRQDQQLCMTSGDGVWSLKIKWPPNSCYKVCNNYNGTSWLGCDSCGQFFHATCINVDCHAAVVSEAHCTCPVWKSWKISSD